MKYKVVLSREAGKSFLRLNPGDFVAVSSVIHSLEENPWSVNSSSVHSRKKSLPNLYRVRARDFRVIYYVETKISTVYVERIARRSERTYKGL